MKTSKVVYVYKIQMRNFAQICLWWDALCQTNYWRHVYCLKQIATCAKLSLIYIHNMWLSLFTKSSSFDGISEDPVCTLISKKYDNSEPQFLDLFLSLPQFSVASVKVFWWLHWKYDPLCTLDTALPDQYADMKAVYNACIHAKWLRLDDRISSDICKLWARYFEASLLLLKLLL